MNAKKAVREIMDYKGISTSKLAEMLGSNMQKVCDRLGMGKSKNLSTDKLDELIRVMGYKIVLMPSDVEIQDGWYEVTDSRMEKEEAPTPVQQ